MTRAALILRLAAALPLALAAAGCSVNHRSGDFTCSDQQRCIEGRTCVDGLCVIAPDAGAFATCPQVCTSCELDKHSCTIDCGSTGSCGIPVACPAGWNCDVLCTVQGTCNRGIFCNDAASCTVTCSGRNTCQTISCGAGSCSVACTGSGSCGNEVTCGTGTCKVACSGGGACNGAVSCGPGPCSVACSGNSACGGEITCGSACACDVACTANASCVAACKPGCEATTPLGGCTSTGNGCNTCP